MSFYAVILNSIMDKYLWEGVELSAEVFETKVKNTFKFLIQYSVGSDFYFVESENEFSSDFIARKKMLNALSELSVNLKNQGLIDFCYH